MRTAEPGPNKLVSHGWGDTVARAWASGEEAPEGQETQRGRGTQGWGGEGSWKAEGSETFLLALPFTDPFHGLNSV